MKNLPFFIILVSIFVSSCSKSPVLKIGLIADPQYSNKPTVGKRYYKQSLWKLEQAIDTFNYHKVDFVQTLGDVIDMEWESYDSILPIYDKLKPGIENYQLLGNHDFVIDSTHLRDLIKRLSMPDYYYSYSERGWRFIVLDAMDYSYYSNVLHKRDASQVNYYYENIKEKPNNKNWNGAIGKEQQNWLKEELKSASLLKQKVILFSHLPLRPQNDAHNLLNDYEIIDIIENSPNVVAFINGHNHAGSYDYKNGIHYITVFGMVDTKISSYGILEIYKDSLVLKGYGNQNTLNLPITTSLNQK